MICYCTPYISRPGSASGSALDFWSFFTPPAQPSVYNYQLHKSPFLSRLPCCRIHRACPLYTTTGRPLFTSLVPISLHQKPVFLDDEESLNSTSSVDRSFETYDPGLNFGLTIGFTKNNCCGVDYYCHRKCAPSTLLRLSRSSPPPGRNTPSSRAPPLGTRLHATPATRCAAPSAFPATTRAARIWRAAAHRPRSARKATMVSTAAAAKTSTARATGAPSSSTRTALLPRPRAPALPPRLVIRPAVPMRL